MVGKMHSIHFITQWSTSYNCIIPPGDKIVLVYSHYNWIAPYVISTALPIKMT